MLSKHKVLSNVILWSKRWRWSSHSVTSPQTCLSVRQSVYLSGLIRMVITQQDEHLSGRSGNSKVFTNWRMIFIPLEIAPRNETTNSLHMIQPTTRTYVAKTYWHTMYCWKEQEGVPRQLSLTDCKEAFDIWLKKLKQNISLQTSILWKIKENYFKRWKYTVLLKLKASGLKFESHHSQ